MQALAIAHNYTRKVISLYLYGVKSNLLLVYLKKFYIRAFCRDLEYFGNFKGMDIYFDRVRV